LRPTQTTSPDRTDEGGHGLTGGLERLRGLIARLSAKPDARFSAVKRLRFRRPAISRFLRIRWRHLRLQKSSVSSRHEAAKHEYAALGGWRVFKSGEWLWLLIQKTFANYWEQATVEQLFERYGTTDSGRISAQLIAGAAVNSALLGVVTGAVVSTDELVTILTALEGGGIGLPANLAVAFSAVSAEAILLVRFQLHLIANLGKLFRVPLEPDKPEDVLAILAFAFAGTTRGASDAAMNVGRRLTHRVAEEIFAEDVSAFVERIGMKVGVKIFQRTILKYVNPVSSIGIGAGWNYLATRKVGRIAVRHFQTRAANLNLDRPMSCSGG